MTELKKKTIVKRLNLESDKRILFVSDIHGDVDTFKSGLEMMNFNDNDYLFIIGDIVEKGDPGKNLECFRYVMELAKKPNVFAMSGNCDEVLRFILPDDQRDRFLYQVNIKKHSILNDMAEEMNYPISPNMDVKDYVKKVQEQYSDLYKFMDELIDIVIINDEIVLVHGGLDDINNIPEYAISILKYDNFYAKSKGVDKLTIVGHYPTRNYRNDMSCCNPIFDFKKKIISIDGGNHVCKGGQINFVFLESLNSMKFGYKYIDHYEKITIKNDVIYDEPQNLVNITFGDNEVEIKDRDLDFYYIHHLKSDEYMWVHNSFVYQDPKNGKDYCYDANNQFISVKAGDIVSVIKRGMPYSVIKKSGYIGLIETKYLG